MSQASAAAPWPALRPRFLGERTLHIDGRAQGIQWPGKRTDHAVALTLFKRPYRAVERNRSVE